jgi:hypothetical protein
MWHPADRIAHRHVPVLLVMRDGTLRCVERQLREIHAAEALQLRVEIGEVAALEQRIIAEVDAGRHVLRHEATCSASDITWRLIVPYERRLSVIMCFGVMPYFFNSRASRRLAALTLRRFRTISSRTSVLIDGKCHRGSACGASGGHSRGQISHPAADRFIGNDDTAPAAFPRPSADSVESEVKPHRIADDLRRETIALVRDGRTVHASASMP